MLFRFAANLSLSEILDWWFVAAYLWGCFVVYAIATAVAFLRGRSIAEAAVEAQCAFPQVLGDCISYHVVSAMGVLGSALQTVDRRDVDASAQLYCARSTHLRRNERV